MREILFKAKRKDNSKWVEGYYVYEEPLKRHYITKQIEDNHVLIEVTPKTVSQYTGLKDKNGVKIFENDRIKRMIFTDKIEYEYYTVKWIEDLGLWGFILDGQDSFHFGQELYQIAGDFEVIGNRLDEKVEIIEEDKDIEEITINGNGTIGFPNGEWTAQKMDEAFAFKINELIREMNKLKNR